MRYKSKFIYVFFFSIIFKNIYSYEIIRDPIFEDYFFKLSNELGLYNLDVFLVDNETHNAFVINNNIYFTTGLLIEIEKEDTLKAIYLHEYGHVIKDHYQSKKLKIHQSSSKNTFLNLFSVGLAVLSKNTDIGIGANITINSKFVNEISKHSINFEIEADNFMINQIKKNKINTSELIGFLNKINDNDIYFRTHPSNEERINILKDIVYKINDNSNKFNWIKSKYAKNSENKNFNNFFINLENGNFDKNNKIDKIDYFLIQYEAYKSGLILDNWETNFQRLLDINDNSYLKIEYINYLIDNNLTDYYFIIDDLKFDENVMDEYYYYFIYGKYYNKIGKLNLSNFYFCQFYKSINTKNKADFFCKKYDIKDIPTLDKSYALFK